MAHVIKPLVGETSASTGAGALTLDAAIIEGGVTTHKRFSAVCSVSDTTEAMVRHDTDGSWAHCLATYSAANELTLTTTVESSTGSAITWAAGGLTIVLTPLSRGVGVGPDNTVTLTSKTLVSPVFVGSPVEDIFTITDGASIALSPANGTIQLLTLGASRTLAAPGTWNNGESMTMMIADGTSYTLTWTSVLAAANWIGGAAPTLAAAGYTVVEMWKVGGTVYASHVGDLA